MEALATPSPHVAPPTAWDPNDLQTRLALTHYPVPGRGMDSTAADGSTGQRRTLPETPNFEQRTRRARQLVHQGELSAARQALTAGPLAPSTAATRDPDRRPPQPYQDFPQHLREFHPPAPPNIPPTQLLTNLRRARKGAAPGPSGFTAEVLRLVLDDDATTQHFVAVATSLAKAEVPHQVSQAIGLGRVVALQKPNGRVRGIVIGDLIVHALTAATEANPQHTILSVDGIGAYDTISRTSMLEGLRRVPDANSCLPFVRQFYAQPSTYVWHDSNGRPHPITQAEGGEQGDPLMPALFSLGQRGALEAVQANLEEGETLFALAHPTESGPETHTNIRLNSGKTRIWNATTHQPQHITSLGPEVWVGNSQLPQQEQGLIVLGAPVGTAEYKRQHLQRLRTEHNALLQQLPQLQDLQASWLLLLYSFGTSHSQNMPRGRGPSHHQHSTHRPQH